MASPSANPVPGPAQYLWSSNTIQAFSGISNSPRPGLIPNHTGFARNVRPIQPKPAQMSLPAQRTVGGPGPVLDASRFARTARQLTPAPVPKLARSKTARELEPDVRLNIPRAAVPRKINPMLVMMQPGRDHKARDIAYLETLTHLPEAAMQAAVQNDPGKFLQSLNAVLPLAKAQEPPVSAFPVRLPGIASLRVPAPALQPQIPISSGLVRREQTGPDRAAHDPDVSYVHLPVPNALQASMAMRRSSTSLTANVPDFRLPMRNSPRTAASSLQSGPPTAMAPRCSPPSLPANMQNVHLSMPTSPPPSASLSPYISPHVSAGVPRPRGTKLTPAEKRKRNSEASKRYLARKRAKKQEIASSAVVSNQQPQEPRAVVAAAEPNLSSSRTIDAMVREMQRDAAQEFQQMKFRGFTGEEALPAERGFAYYGPVARAVARIVRPRPRTRLEKPKHHPAPDAPPFVYAEAARSRRAIDEDYDIDLDAEMRTAANE
jgi:hypothetical protein